MAFRLLFTGDTLSEADKKRIKDLGFELVIQRADLTEDELVAALTDVDVYILGGAEKATDKVLNAAKSLKILAFFGVGYQSFVNIEAASQNGIVVTNTPGANAESVAEFTLCLIVDAVKKLTFLANQTKQGVWKEIRTWNLKGRYLGIIGMGTVGYTVAKIASQGFGMNILYNSRSKKPAIERELGAKFMPLDDLCKTADVISIHASYSPETIGLIGKKQFETMKPTAVLVNAARAEIVDPRELFVALKDNKIACAAMDGYYVEPVPHPSQDKYGLVGLSDEKIVISPHTAYLTEDAMNTMLDMCLNSIVNLINNKTDAFIVNPHILSTSRISKE